jgi:hypothetical protein
MESFIEQLAILSRAVPVVLLIAAVISFTTKSVSRYMRSLMRGIPFNLLMTDTSEFAEFFVMVLGLILFGMLIPLQFIISSGQPSANDWIVSVVGIFISFLLCIHIWIGPRLKKRIKQLKRRKCIIMIGLLFILVISVAVSMLMKCKSGFVTGWALWLVISVLAALSKTIMGDIQRFFTFKDKDKKFIVMAKHSSDKWIVMEYVKENDTIKYDIKSLHIRCIDGCKLSEVSGIKIEQQFDGEAKCKKHDHSKAKFAGSARTPQTFEKV